MNRKKIFQPWSSKTLKHTLSKSDTIDVTNNSFLWEINPRTKSCPFLNLIKLVFSKAEKLLKSINARSTDWLTEYSLWYSRKFLSQNKQPWPFDWCKWHQRTKFIREFIISFFYSFTKLFPVPIAKSKLYFSLYFSFLNVNYLKN